MPFVEELKRDLTPHQLAIWNGTSGLPADKEEAYRARWRGQSSPKVAKTVSLPVLPDCPHLGEPTGEAIGCGSCGNGAKLKVFSCAKHGETTIAKPATGKSCCRTCDDNPANIARKASIAEAAEKKDRAAAVAVHPAMKMVAPRDKRPHVWRGGVLQIWVTRACDRACFGCTQCSNLAGKPEFITVDQFKVAVESLRGYFGVIGMFGGNPVLHPQFDELCSVLRGSVPWEQRGLWSNHPKGKGRTAAITFNPAHSNLNVHESQEAYDEFARDWPECIPYLKGLDSDSRHSPPFVAMRDVLKRPCPDCSGNSWKNGRDGICQTCDDSGLVYDKEQAWGLIQQCDVNRNWSAMIGVFRGQLRGYFCELAASQAMLHQWDSEDCRDCGGSGYKPMQYGPHSGEPYPCFDCGPADGYGPEFGKQWSYPDTGVPVVPGWWNKGIDAFLHQAEKHCHECGIPLKGYGALANSGPTEQVSATHAAVYNPKRMRPVELVTELIQLGKLTRVTDYIENGSIK